MTLMDPTDDKPSSLRPKLYFSLEGAGVHPGNIPLNQLAELLEAARATVERVAGETGRESPRLALTAIEAGSALYALSPTDPSEDDQFAAIVPTVHRAVKTRGEGFGDDVKQALKRLHKVGQQSGGLSVRAEHVGLGSARNLKRVVMAPPLTERTSSLTASTVLFGQVVAVEAKRGKMTIRLKPTTGAAIELEADDRLARRAAAFFFEDVEVRALARATEDWPWSKWEAVSIERWQPSSLLSVMDEIAGEMEDFDAAALIRALDEDE